MLFLRRAVVLEKRYTVRSFNGKSPVIPESCSIFENVSIYGDVAFGEKCVVMPGCVIRAETGRIVIGDNTNIQDLCCIHTDTYEGADVIIGKNVTVGHMALLHACRVDDGALIGMGAVVLNGAHVCKNAMVSAGALVTQNTVVEEGSLCIGVPAKTKRHVSDAEIKDMEDTIEEYANVADAYLKDEGGF